MLWPPDQVRLGLFLLALGSGRPAGEVACGAHCSGAAGRVEAHGAGQVEGELFLTGNLSRVEAHAGTLAALHCRVARGRDHGTISWFRRRHHGPGLVLLTVGDEPYVQDPRVSIVRPVLSMNWQLQIQGVRPEDGGEYTCQSTAHPPTSIIATLTVFEAYATITGSKEKVFRVGSEMQLVCVIRDVTETPSFVFWYHNARMINYDAVAGVEVQVSPLARGTLRSTLTVGSVTSAGSGNYSCSPSTVRPDTVSVRVKRLPAGPPEPVVNMAAALRPSALLQALRPSALLKALQPSALALGIIATLAPQG